MHLIFFEEIISKQKQIRWNFGKFQLGTFLVHFLGKISTSLLCSI